ncbi:oxysterol-binding protein-related protein 10 [Syngnathus typhle]|uniref:oxysterol-binding protein-related protein 10 n=1 Tax=Syngnathus typhle TaxID=161592 RepID=UPI002A6B5998|nr:oxysterol-binding protein-related protein 10 [Syngnathus typhle]XP_061122864.1 oxysterol-binding protein-related protein 10 [Syngnathus typhle]XP_061122865.1 oxysterol-binding protein-related protein 10 [Syngnathus typhle]XP_061122867.1 oxysterol-binding protein-related protein 10 [Syngnathus typhle]XP_061122868.1 oxysterol-binding protein-related protein 10 [Syngnathus typhle]XP_061122869.1 oxysterol-binding protein-related protein 10 [Syngnathus typhle]
MDRTASSLHHGTNKSNSNSSGDRSNSSRKPGGWTGSPSPGPGPHCGPAGAGGGRGAFLGNSTSSQQGRKRQLEGVLSKYTNLIQGWQNRYFVLDPDLGSLLYYVNEQGRSQKPRGSLPLIGATITQSDEVPHMFIVNSVNGEMYKLRASDAKEQQYWVSQLQACARRHSDCSAKVRKLKGSDEHLSAEESAGGQDALGSSSSGRNRSFSLLPHLTPTSSPASQRQLTHTSSPGNIVTITHHKSPAAARRAKNQYPGRLLEVKEMMSQAEGQQKNLVHSIDSLPTKGSVSCLDQDLLLLKATSAATLSCLGECLNILQQTQSHSQVPPPSQATQRNHTVHGAPTDGAPVWTVPKSPSGQHLKNGDLTPLRSAEPSPALRERSLSHGVEHQAELGDISQSEEVTDTEDNEEEDLGVLDDQRSVILHLLSQLKLGMDLTRVVLPTFILEKRSLLEMYANFMAHPDLFLSITAGVTPEERIVRFVEYYLTSFHEGRKGAVAKKPYNPILGETFHCSWEVPRDKVKLSLRTNQGCVRESGRSPNNAAAPQGDEEAPGACYRVRFVAEQVSHHPPVSAFYCECRERQVCVNAHVWTKSKFMGMSIGVSMVGEGVLCLVEHEEEYVFSLPSAYARSILTVPWVELGGKVSINCAKSGYSATVTFHTKPFYGGKVHRVTAEVKHNPTNTIVCKAQGEWNGTLEFTYSSGETKVIDTAKLAVTRKKLRALERQGRMESRRLWQHVTKSLKDGNMDEATEHKHGLEEQQRADERRRAAVNKAWTPKYFTKEGDTWMYNNPLWKCT